MLVYLPVLVPVGDAEVGHGAQYRHQRLDRVAVYHGSVLLEVFIRKSTFVDNPGGGCVFINMFKFWFKLPTVFSFFIAGYRLICNTINFYYGINL